MGARLRVPLRLVCTIVRQQLCRDVGCRRLVYDDGITQNHLTVHYGHVRLGRTGGTRIHCLHDSYIGRN